MKFLLCALNAKYIHSNPAVYSLRAYAGEEWREKVEIAEYTINQYADDILADLYHRRPDVIGFSCYIWNWSLVRELLEELPKLLPRVPIWLGGPEVTYDADKVLQRFPMLAGIMVGEGEATFRDLMEYYGGRSGKELWEIPGLCLPERELRGSLGESLPDEGVRESLGKSLQDEGVRGSLGEGLPGRYTAARPPMDLNELPFPYEDPGQFANKIIYYETSRGCPYRCSYCLSSIGSGVRLRDFRLVQKELQFFLDARVAQVKFVDRTFNCNHEHTMAIWGYLLEHDNGVTNFHFEISADLLRPDEIALLHRMRPGLVQLEIGVQTANPATLRAIRRNMNLEHLEQVVARIREGGNVHQHLDLIAGLPYEDYESFGVSFDRVYAMKPQQLQLGFLKVLKGSEMERRAEEFGICRQSKPPYEVLYTRWLPYEDVLRLKRVEEMVELYYNSGQFAHTLAYLAEAFPSPFAMYEALAEFYLEKGYFTNHPARSYRYQALLDFAAGKDPEREAVYREVLTFDFYLRENGKSRPEFAKDVQAFREEMREFYRGTKRLRELLPAYQAYEERQIARMTHLEPFDYPVWDGALLRGTCLKGDRRFVLFDYRERDPLTYDARFVVVKDARM